MEGAPRFFANAGAFRAWLKKHHATKTELLVGFRKVATGRASISWPESVDQALAFGWIDGVRKRLDDDAYTIRFTPRRVGSTWSTKNIARVKALERSGLMEPPGLAAFAARTSEKSRIYSYEQRPQELPEAEEKVFRKQAAAWKYFSECPPGYRKTLTWWVVSARQIATRKRRLEILIACSAKGERVP